MTNNLIFGTWGRRFRRIIKENKSAIPAKAHEEKKPYCLSVGENREHPDCYLEINNDAFGVGFIDEDRRLGLKQMYIEFKANKLFLNLATYREYDEGSNTVNKMTEFIFSPEGELVISITDYKTNLVETNKAEDKVDVSDFWFDYPKFGCYNELIYNNKFPKDIREIDLSGI